MMKIPEIFLPEKNLENKVNNLTKSKIKSKHVGEVIEQPINDGKRKILLYFKDTIRLPNDGIYVWVRHPYSKNSGFFELSSKSQFYAPYSEYDMFSSRDTKNKIKKIKAYLTSDLAKFKYLKSLIRQNNGILLWEDNEELLEFKKRKDTYESLYYV